MTDNKLPENIENKDPSSMSTIELRKTHEKLWEIIEEKELINEDSISDKKSIGKMRNLMKKIIKERVDRQREEVGRSPE